MTPQPQEKVKIMILDDAPEYCANLQQAFANIVDFEVVYVAHDAIVALKAIKKFHPDVVIFDLILSGIDGISFLEEAMRITGDSDIKYVAISIISNESAIQQILDLRACYYMVKPVNYDFLCDRLLMLCGRRQPSTILPKYAIPETEGADLENCITEILLLVGIPAHIMGYRFARSSILLAIESPSSMNGVTKNIYPEVAKIYDTHVPQVERAIRHAIDVAYKRGDPCVLNEIFGHSISRKRGRPTNSEFIAIIAERIRLENKKTASDTELDHCENRKNGAFHGIA